MKSPSELIYEREVRNQTAFAHPSPGDYWNEMMVPYFVVLDVLDNGNLIICDKREDLHDHWTWDFAKAKEVPREYMKRVQYKNSPGFVASVAKLQHDWAVKYWNDIGCPCIKYTDQITKPADFRTVMEQGV